MSLPTDFYLTEEDIANLCEKVVRDAALLEAQRLRDASILENEDDVVYPLPFVLLNKEERTWD